MNVYEYLLSYNIKPSVQRIAIMDYLLKHHTHPCAWFNAGASLVHTKPGAEPKRVLLAFGRKICAYDTEHLVVELDRHVYSKDYIELTKDFYLNM